MLIFAGVKKPISSEGAQIKDDPDYSIAMGADALSSKLAITEAITDPTTVSTDLKNRLYNMKQLEKVKLDELQFVPFKYMLKPYEPTKKDAPKRALILVGGDLCWLHSFCYGCFTELYGKKPS